MLYVDQITYMSDDILTKVDRAAMANSLETRIPFLDRRVIELSWRIPMKMKIDGAQGKLILKNILYQYVPKKLIERPKAGFGVPLDRWLREDLKDWASDLLSEQKIKQQGFIDSKQVKKIWSEHLSGRGNWQYHLWDILMFQSWQEKHL